MSFRFPNLFRSLFAEGAFNSAFVPMFNKRLQAEGEESARQFAEEALAILLVGVIATTILAEIFMPYLVRALAMGFAGEQVRARRFLTRITFPYLACMAFVALTGGHLERARQIQRARRHADPAQSRLDRGHALRRRGRLLRSAGSRHHPGVGRDHRGLRAARFTWPMPRGGSAWIWVSAGRA